SLFELRSILLDLFHQDGPNALDQPNAIRGHGQEPLGRIDPGFDKYGCCPMTEPTLCKTLVPIKFICSGTHAPPPIPPWEKTKKKFFGGGNSFSRGAGATKVPSRWAG